MGVGVGRSKDGKDSLAKLLRFSMSNYEITEQTTWQKEHNNNTRYY